VVANADVELELSRAISDVLRRLGLEILPHGYRCEVHLHRGNRKKRRDADFETNWDPDADSIRVGFTPLEEDVDAVKDQESRSPLSGNGTSADDRISDVVRALDRAEGRPGYEFVSLKWFRDTALRHEEFPWAADEAARHDALREAIDRRWILTSKIANPRPPHFPGTAIRLNRQLPAVNAALGERPGSLPGSRPVPIRGEPLSATVLRDRR
jgi:hypothetical protein